MPEVEGDAIPAQSKGSWSSFLKVRNQTPEGKCRLTDVYSPLPRSTVTWPH